MKNDQADVPLNRAVFRQSIWESKGEYRFHDYTPSELDHIARVFDLMAAKLNIAFPTPEASLLLVEATFILPDDPKKVPDGDLVSHLEKYLNTTRALRGIQIATSMCMLSVQKKGCYAPMDRKVAAGLHALGVLTEDEAISLTGTSTKKFVDIYVKKVLPAWYVERLHKTAREVDEGWASKAKNESKV